MKVRNLDGLKWLHALAARTGAFSVAAQKRGGALSASVRADALVQILPAGARSPIGMRVEQRKEITPLEALGLIARWRSTPQHPLLVFCRFASPRVQQVFREAGVNFLDRSGNCRISAKNLHLEVIGQPNLYPEKRRKGKLFAPKSSRIARVMLENPHSTWSVQQLAKTARISIGLASRVKTWLIEQGYVFDVGGMCSLRDPEGLLRTWAAAYSDEREISTFYVMSSVEELETRVARWCEDQKLTYGLSDMAGAWRLAPMVRYNRATITIKLSDAGDFSKELIHFLNASVADTGSNLAIYTTADEFVFNSSTQVDGLTVLSPIQLYLDLSTRAGRGKEAADALYDRILRPRFSLISKP